MTTKHPGWEKMIHPRIHQVKSMPLHTGDILIERTGRLAGFTLTPSSELDTSPILAGPGFLTSSGTVIASDWVW